MTYLLKTPTCAAKTNPLGIKNYFLKSLSIKTWSEKIHKGERCKIFTGQQCLAVSAKFPLKDW